MAFAVKNVVQLAFDIRSINVAIFERKKKNTNSEKKKCQSSFIYDLDLVKIYLSYHFVNQINHN